MYTEEELRNLFRETAESEEARMAFAESLADPIKAIVNKGTVLEDASVEAAITIPILKTAAPISTVRRIFTPDTLQPGQQAVYPKDFPDMKAYTMSKHGAAPTVIFDRNEEVIVPTYEIEANEEYRKKYARDARFNVAERAMFKLAKAMIEKEEKDGWKVLKAACTEGNGNLIPLAAGTTKVSLSQLNRAYATFENLKEGNSVRLVVMNRNRKADIVEWTDVDDITKRETIVNKGASVLWNAEILVKPDLADDEIYMIDTLDFAVMPIRQDIQTYDDPTAVRRKAIGLLSDEEIGFAVLDVLKIVKIVLPTTEG